MPTKKTIVVPCIVNSWLNVSGPMQVVVRTEELPAHQERFAAADDQEHHGHHDVHDADLLVIDGGHPVVEHGRPAAVGVRSLQFVFDDGHAAISVLVIGRLLQRCQII